MATELDVLKEIPGYKAILKSVLKSQIQMLMEQLSNQTGEESIILTASVHDGSLSHLGSNTGKGFLEGRDEIKAQFLGYCLKSQHTKESQEAECPQYNRSRTLMPPARRQRPRIRPAPYSIGSPGANSIVTSSPSFQMSSQHDISEMKTSNNSSVKTETADAADNFLDSVTSDGDVEFPAVDDSNLSNQATNQNESFDSSQSSSQDNIGNSVQTVKTEPQSADNDLEVTGIEMGDNSLSSSENWGQGYGSSGQNDGGQPDQNSYNALWLQSSQNWPQSAVESLSSNSHPGGNFMRQFPVNRGFLSRHILDNVTGRTMESHREINDDTTAVSPAESSSNPVQPGTNMYINCSYSCASCNLKFATKGQHMNHLYDIHKVPHYDCDFCGRRFRMRQQMETHRRMHTGEKPYKCTSCDAAYANAASLRYHKMKVHTGQQ
ncbi:myoneurin-like isoform X2 [Ruditapes philippinarum]|uniref:myoneurin-like isoform X2 n=1 Tax=Ruditapes philippinarum TaxID=129788 RepID=UPI00295B5724|nr:myoneurin-like isoform X2 [Ruditapes philippinarum]